MKQTYSMIALFLMTAIAFAQQPIITAIVDGDCTGGTPKLLEIYAQGTVDFSLYTIQNQTNANTGNFSAGETMSSLGIVTDGFVYLTVSNNSSNDAALVTDFPSLSNAKILKTSQMNVNGNDRLRIVNNNGTVIDQYGVTDVDGTGTAWEYSDSYATRIDGTGPDGGFTLANWSFAGAGAIDNRGACKNNANDTATYESIVEIGTYSTQANTSPTLSVSGSPITGLDYFENNGPSAEQQFTVSGSNLTSAVNVNSTVFEISLISGAGYTNEVSIAFPSNGSLPTTVVYVRLPEGLPAGDYAESIVVSSPGAPSENAVVAGTVTADTPQVTISGDVDNLQYSEGNGPSTADAFAVSGLFLDQSGIAVTVGTPFELSLTTDGTFSPSVTIPADANNEVNAVDVFVRLAAGQTLGEFTGTITASATGATDDTLSITGSVFASANCAPAGSIIITEIMQNPTAAPDATGEYFELYNTTSNDIDIESWIIRDNGTESHVISTSVIVPAGGYILLARSATANGGLTPNYIYGTDITLGNSDDEVIIVCGNTLIDAVEYDGGPNFPDPIGASMELSTSTLDGASNDIGSNWGTATTVYGAGDFGTPGAANDFTLSNNSVNSLQFSLYPNPVTNGQLNINASNGGSFDIEIYSTLGQKMIDVKSVTNTINVDRLNTGLYLVKITQGDATQTRKLIVN